MQTMAEGVVGEIVELLEQLEGKKLSSFLGKGDIQDRGFVRRRMVRVFLRTHCPKVSDSWVRLACNF